MKIIPASLLLITFLFILTSASVIRSVNVPEINTAVTTPINSISEPIVPNPNNSVQKFHQGMKIKEVESILGRKMKFWEKLAFSLNKKKIIDVLEEVGKPQKNTNAILGFVFTLLGILIWPFLILGLIFSIIGLNDAKKMGGKGKGLAKAGIIIIATLFTIALLIFSVYFLIVQSFH